MTIKDNQKKYLESVRKAKNGVYSSLNTKEGFNDCCTEFRFIRAFDTINFNNKMNRLGLTHLVLDDGYNFTEVLEADIIEPILNRSNNVFGIIGKTGTGKSELAETIVLICKKANRDFLNRDVQLYLCYTWGDFHSTLPKLNKGDIVWKDETPRTVGKGSRIEKWDIENVLHAIRKMENTFIFIDPLDIKLDLCDLYLESAGMSFKTRTNRFMLLNQKKEYFGHIYAKLHNNERFRDWYETQKDRFIDEIKDKAGRVNVEEEEDDEGKNGYSIEKFLKKNYKSVNKERDIDIYLRYEAGEGSFDKLAKKYKLSAGASIKYIYDKVKEFIEENYEGEL